MRKLHERSNLAIHIEWWCLELKIDGVLDTLLSMGIVVRARQKILLKHEYMNQGSTEFLVAVDHR